MSRTSTTFMLASFAVKSQKLELNYSVRVLAKYGINETTHWSFNHRHRRHRLPWNLKTRQSQRRIYQQCLTENTPFLPLSCLGGVVFAGGDATVQSSQRREEDIGTTVLPGGGGTALVVFTVLVPFSAANESKLPPRLGVIRSPKETGTGVKGIA
jgi:hypothetical protein